MIKAVIFDMDGVLIDSEPLWYKAEVDIYKKLGFILTKAMYEETVGMRYDHAVRHWFKKFPWKKPPLRVVELGILKKTMSIIKKEGKQKEGVNDLLLLFKNKGIKIALASSSPLKIINIVLEKLQVIPFFDFIHSGEFEKNPKPHPDIFITTANKLKVDAKECLVIEDSVFGIIAARNAQMKCIAITDNRYRINDSKYSANYYLSSLNGFDQEFLDKIMR